MAYTRSLCRLVAIMFVVQMYLNYCCLPLYHIKVTDSAGDLWAQYKDTDEKLFQVQVDMRGATHALSVLIVFTYEQYAVPSSPVDHDARPSVSVNIRRSLEEYLKAHPLAGIDTIQKLQSECGFKLTMTGKDDPDSLNCFVQYRIAFYVAGGLGSLVNFFLFLDGFFQFKCKQFARATPFEVKIHPYDLFSIHTIRGTALLFCSFCQSMVVHVAC